jgi:hypothetical protein
MKRFLTAILLCLVILPCNSQTKPSWTQLKNAPISSVLEYGAIPDDNIDDTSALRAAFTNGGIVVLPPGEYNISGPVAWDPVILTRSLTICGPGRIKVTSGLTSYPYAAIFLQCKEALEIKINITGITLDGSDVCHFGIYVNTAGETAGNSLSITQCTIKNFRGQTGTNRGGNGIFCGGSFDTIEIRGNSIHDIARGEGTSVGSFGASGIAVISDAVTDISNNIITGIESTPDMDIPYWDADGIKVFAQTVDTADPSTIAGKVSISNNTIINCHSRFIKLQTPNATISANNLYSLSGIVSSGFCAIDCWRGSATITNNVFRVAGIASLTINPTGYRCISATPYPTATLYEFLIETNHFYFDQPIGEIFNLSLRTEWVLRPVSFQILENSVQGSCNMVTRISTLGSATAFGSDVLVGVKNNHINGNGHLVSYADTGVMSSYTTSLALTTIVTDNVSINSTDSYAILSTTNTGRLLVRDNIGQPKNVIVVAPKLVLGETILSGSKFEFSRWAGTDGIVNAPEGFRDGNVLVDTTNIVVRLTKIGGYPDYLLTQITGCVVGITFFTTP